MRHLKDDGIEERNIYVLAKSDAGLQDLPDPGPEADDFLPAFERGVGIGGLAGLFLGIVALVFRSTSRIVGGGGVLLAGLVGASLGGLLTGMAGTAFRAPGCACSSRRSRRARFWSWSMCRKTGSPTSTG